MRIHVDSETVFSAFAEDTDGIVHKLVVIFFRSSMLQRLPSKWKPEEIEAPASQSREVDVCTAIIDVERSADKGNVVSVCALPEID